MRKMIGILGIGVLLLAQMPAMEVNAAAVHSVQESVVEEETTSIRATITKWYYRTYNGVEQKRLWSVTEQKWLTDWIDC